MKKKITLLVLLTFFSACSTLIRQAPSLNQIEDGNYGPIPIESQLKDYVRSCLIKSKYKDPNSAQIENCTPISKSWIHNPAMWGNDNAPQYVFGYSTSCDVNAKNGFGAYVGFKTSEFFIKNNQCLKIVNRNNTLWEAPAH